MAVFRVLHNYMISLFSSPSSLFDYRDFSLFLRDKFLVGSLYVCGSDYCMHHVTAYLVNAPEDI